MGADDQCYRIRLGLECPDYRVFGVRLTEVERKWLPKVLEWQLIDFCNESLDESHLESAIEAAGESLRDVEKNAVLSILQNFANKEDGAGSYRAFLEEHLEEIEHLVMMRCIHCELVPVAASHEQKKWKPSKAIKTHFDRLTERLAIMRSLEQLTEAQCSSVSQLDVGAKCGGRSFEMLIAKVESNIDWYLSEPIRHEWDVGQIKPVWRIVDLIASSKNIRFGELKDTWTMDGQSIHLDHTDSRTGDVEMVKWEI